MNNMVISNQIANNKDMGIETRDGKRLSGLICSFLIEKGEEYALRYRYNAEAITGDFREWLSLRDRYTLWTDKKLYGLIEARLDYVLELRARFEIARARVGVNINQVAAMFGYRNDASFLLSTRRNKNISAFLRIVEAIMP